MQFIILISSLLTVATGFLFLALFQRFRAAAKAKRSEAPVAAPPVLPDPVDAPTETPFIARESLLNPTEIAFLNALETALPGNLRALVKVRLAELLAARRDVAPAVWQEAFRHSCSRHVDFLIVHAHTFAPVAAIELDDAAYHHEERRQRNAFVHAAFTAAGIPLFHLPAQETYELPELRQKLALLLPPVPDLPKPEPAPVALAKPAAAPRIRIGPIGAYTM